MVSTAASGGIAGASGKFPNFSPIEGDADSGRMMFSGVSPGRPVRSGGLGGGPMETPLALSMPGTDNDPMMPTLRTAASVAM
jgi:hypothetical protein